MFKKIFMAILALGLMASFASADDGSGALPGTDLSTDVAGCATDQYGGRWHLTAAHGSITGYRDNISNCVWNVSGTNTGLSFHMNLSLTSGTSCCTSGYTDGTVNKKQKNATGQTYWTGNCNSGPHAYTWTAGC